MTVDSVVWAQYITVTDRHEHSHIATANAGPRQTDRQTQPHRHSKCWAKTDRQTDRQTDTHSHIAIANAGPRQTDRQTNTATSP